MEHFIKIGNKLREYRIRANVSQLQLELSIGASTGSISRIENGFVNPSKETLLKIAEVLNLNFLEKAELLGISISEDEINYLIRNASIVKSLIKVSAH